MKRCPSTPINAARVLGHALSARFFQRGVSQKRLKRCPQHRHKCGAGSWRRAGRTFFSEGDVAKKIETVSPNMRGGCLAARWAHRRSTAVSPESLKRRPHAKTETVPDYWVNSRHDATHANSSGDFVPKHFGEHCARQVSQKRLKQKMQVLLRSTSVTHSLPKLCWHQRASAPPYTAQQQQPRFSTGWVCRSCLPAGAVRHHGAQPVTA